MTFDLPTTPGGFACILADPAWTYTTWSDTNQDRRPQDQYSCMSIDEIRAMPVREIAAPDSWLWLWATGPHLRMAFDVIDDWGYTYSGIGLSWMKVKRGWTPERIELALCAGGGWRALQRILHVGMGRTTRHNAEICLLAKRGNSVRLDAGVPEPILSPVREHSRKPDEQYERIERMCPGPRLELFSRTARPGWTQWGNDAGKFVA